MAAAQQWWGSRRRVSAIAERTGQRQPVLGESGPLLRAHCDRVRELQRDEISNVASGRARGRRGAAVLPRSARALREDGDEPVLPVWHGVAEFRIRFEGPHASEEAPEVRWNPPVCVCSEALSPRIRDLNPPAPPLRCVCDHLVHARLEQSREPVDGIVLRRCGVAARR